MVAAEAQSFLQGVDAGVRGEQRLRVDAEKTLDRFCVELLMRQAALGIQTERICRRVNSRRLRGRGGSPVSPRRALEACFEGVQERLIPFSISAQDRASSFNGGENGGAGTVRTERVAGGMRASTTTHTSCRSGECAATMRAGAARFLRKRRVVFLGTRRPAEAAELSWCMQNSRERVEDGCRRTGGALGLRKLGQR